MISSVLERLIAIRLDSGFTIEGCILVIHPLSPGSNCEPSPTWKLLKVPYLIAVQVENATVLLAPLGPWLLMDTVMLNEIGVAVLRWLYFVGFQLSSCPRC